MRYFFYVKEDGSNGTIIKVDDNKGLVKMFPDRHLSPNYWGDDKIGWMRYYEGRKSKNIAYTAQMFEICENQAKKFMERSIVPMDFDC